MKAVGRVFVITYMYIIQMFQVVWFTAIFPYIVLSAFFVYGLTLPGSADGIRFYLFEPDLEKLWDGTVSRILLNI